MCAETIHCSHISWRSMLKSYSFRISTVTWLFQHFSFRVCLPAKNFNERLLKKKLVFHSIGKGCLCKSLIFTKGIRVNFSVTSRGFGGFSAIPLHSGKTRRDITPGSVQRICPRPFPIFMPCIGYPSSLRITEESKVMRMSAGSACKRFSGLNPKNFNGLAFTRIAKVFQRSNFRISKAAWERPEFQKFDDFIQVLCQFWDSPFGNRCCSPFRLPAPLMTVKPEGP